jgi:hypothetical protein
MVGMDQASQALSSFELGGKIGPYGSDAVMIQIIGIIYIYNEPDLEKLATGASAQESGLEGGVAPENAESGTESDTGAATGTTTDEGTTEETPAA